MTETSGLVAPASTVLKLGDTLFEYGKTCNIVTHGAKQKNVEIVINDPNDDGSGEILISGRSIMMGYYKD